MEELKDVFECQDCGHRDLWSMMNLRSHGGRDCPKCGGELERKEPTAREKLSYPPFRFENL